MSGRVAPSAAARGVLRVFMRARREPPRLPCGTLAVKSRKTNCRGGAAMNAGEQLADMIERLARENPDWTETQVLEAMAEVTRKLRGQNPDWTQTQVIEAVPQGVEKFRRENPDWAAMRPDYGVEGVPSSGVVLR